MKLLPDWSGLVPELLEQIAKCLPLVEDFTAFRGVCTTWRAAVSKNKYQFKVPLLMLAEKQRSHKCKRYTRNMRRLCREKITCRIKMKPCGQKCKIHRLLCRRNKKQEHNHEREFLSLSKRKICARLPFPDAENKRCLDVGFGWMLAVSASKCSKCSLGYTKYGKHSFDDSDTRYGKFDLGDISDGKVSLVKPFYSCPEIKLPNLTKFSAYKESGRRPDYVFFIRGVLLGNPSETSDFTLVLLTDNFIVFWRNGDKNFTVINPDIRRYFFDMVFYRGCIYAMDGGGKIWIWDPKGNDLTKACVIMQLRKAENLYDNFLTKLYLVESTEGELLVILRNHRCMNNYNVVKYGTHNFKGMRVNLEALRFERIESVGKDAIFLGNNIAAAGAASDYPNVLRPNCIYFTDDCHEGYFGEPEYAKGGGKDIGVYDVESKRIGWFEGIKSFSPISPPMWIFPSF